MIVIALIGLPLTGPHGATPIGDREGGAGTSHLSGFPGPTPW
jgi:hypothetical protein